MYRTPPGEREPPLDPEETPGAEISAEESSTRPEGAAGGVGTSTAQALNSVVRGEGAANQENAVAADADNPPASASAAGASSDEEFGEVPDVREGEELPFEEYTELPAPEGQYLYRYIRTVGISPSLEFNISALGATLSGRLRHMKGYAVRVPWRVTEPKFCKLFTCGPYAKGKEVVSDPQSDPRLMVDDLDSRMSRIEQLAKERLGATPSGASTSAASGVAEVTAKERLQVETGVVKHHPFLQAAVGNGLPTQVPELVDLLHREFSAIADHLETTRQQHGIFRKEVDTQIEKVHSQLFACGGALEDLHHRSTRLEIGIQEAQSGIQEARHKTEIHEAKAEIKSELSKAQAQAKASDAQAKAHFDEVLRCLTGGPKPTVPDTCDQPPKPVTLDASGPPPKADMNPVSFTQTAHLSMDGVGLVQGSTQGDPVAPDMSGNGALTLRPTYATVADPTYRNDGDPSAGP